MPISDWWGKAVKRQLAVKKLTQKKLAADLGIDEPELSRALKPIKKEGKPVYEIVLAISDALDLPYPVILPDSEDEALHLTTQRRLYKSTAQLAEITSGVAETKEESQTLDVLSVDGKQRRRPPTKKRTATRV